MPPCLTLSDIRYVSTVKWSNPGKGVAPSSLPRCSSYWKGRVLVAKNYIIIIMSCSWHGYPGHSLATSSYRSSPLADLQGYIPYPHIAVVCMFSLVLLLLLGHMWGVHRSTSLTSSPLLLQQCPACLVRLIWIVFVMEGRWPYSWCLLGCCRQDLFNIARSILV